MPVLGKIAIKSLLTIVIQDFTLHHISRITLHNSTILSVDFSLEIIQQIMMEYMPLLELNFVLLFVVVICGEGP